MKEDSTKALRMLEQVREADDAGRVVLRLGLIATWYFHQGYTWEKRRAVTECYDEFRASFGEQLRWWVVEGGRFNRVDKLKGRDLGPYLFLCLKEVRRYVHPCQQVRHIRSRQRPVHKASRLRCHAAGGEKTMR